MLTILWNLLQLFACVVNYCLLVLNLIIGIDLSRCLLHLLLNEFFIYFGNILEYYLGIGLWCLLILCIYLMLILAHIMQLLYLEHLVLHMTTRA